MKHSPRDGFPEMRGMHAFFACMFLAVFSGTARSQPFHREEIIAAYLFNFSKNIEWQNEAGIREFHFLIISDDKALNGEMSRLSASKKLKKRPIRITVSESVILPKDIHLVFISRGLKDLTEPVFRRIEGQNVLLITDGFDDKRMVMINLVGTNDNRIRFEINKANIINQELKVLPEMVLLGGTEIDVAKLYKASQDSLRIKESKLSELRARLDSLNLKIGTTRKEIDRQNLLISQQGQVVSEQNKSIMMQQENILEQNKDILEQKIRLEKQRDTLSRQTGRLHKSQQLLERQQAEIEKGKAVLSDQQRRIDGQNAAILRQNKVLEEQNLTIADQKSIQRFLILTLVLVLGLSYAIYRGYRINKKANRRLQRQEGRIKELNRDLLERANALETANKELEAFSYSVSHDLRAPLRSIDGFSQAIIEDYPDGIDDRGKDYLRRVRSAAQRMARLIDDMLDLSRVTRNEMAFREVDLSGMAMDVAEKLRAQEPERAVDFVIHPGMSVMGDEPLLRIAVENLFNNSWKYTSKHPAARIEFGCRTSGGSRVFFVADDGAGFDMKYAQKLFGAFQRMHTAEEFPGTGVGLATVQRIMRRHGGRIWAESEVEKGATFHFSISEKEAVDGGPKIDSAG